MLRKVAVAIIIVIVNGKTQTSPSSAEEEHSLRWAIHYLNIRRWWKETSA